LATDRNRIKRNIYDSVADIDNLSNDILFIVNKEAVEMSKNQIKQEISTVFPHK
jgi:ribonuclease P protein component